MPSFANRVELEDVTVESETQSGLAVWISYDGKKVCIPQSQIDDDSEVWKVGQKGTMIVSEWIAIQKGLV